MSNKRLNTESAAAYLGEGIQPKTLEAYRVRGGGPAYYRLGKRVVYDTDDLDAWLASKKRLSTTVPAEAAEAASAQ